MRVLIFGDSITQGFWDTEGGWVARLRKAYDLKAVETGDYDQPTIFNLGVSGDSSDNILNRFDAETQSRASEELAFVIAVGVNDSRTKAGTIYSTVEQYVQNLASILAKAQQHSNKILFVGLTPCVEARSNPVSWGDTGYTNARIEEFDSALRSFCEESQIKFVEILQPFKNAGDEDGMLPDSLHPSDKGHQFMADLVNPAIERVTEQMSSIPCDVAILPSDELAGKAIVVSQALKPLGTLFTLRFGEFYPHASVYMLQLQADDLPMAMELLAKIAANTNTINLTANRYYQSKNFFDAEYQKPEELSVLQTIVVDSINPIRDAMREKDKERMAEASGLALENYKKYGWNTIGDLYRPHLTLTRFESEQQNPERDLPAVSEFSGQFSKLCLFEMGDNGTAVRLIESWNFKEY